MRPIKSSSTNHQARNISALAFKKFSRFTRNTKKDWMVKQANDYSDYLDYLGQFTDPCPMYQQHFMRTVWQKESFYRQHLLVDDRQKQAIRNSWSKESRSVRLYIKRFPVWFSFRGNNGILLSMVKRSSDGRLLDRQTPLDKADQQLQWMVGKIHSGNQWFMVGYNYPQQYSVSSGNDWQMPVGFRTFGNEDEPLLAAI